jgi:DNA topoisomerase-3
MQVIEVCRIVKASIAVKRARFSALVPSEIKRAINGTIEPNKREAEAVEARSVLDLRYGAAFTRFQTLLLQVCGLVRSISSSLPPCDICMGDEQGVT